jgi:hypothetical protein
VCSDASLLGQQFRVGPKKSFLLFWAVHVDVWVAAENRNKSNEVVIGRPDISCVVPYVRATTMLDTQLVLIREYRPPARSADGFVHELPGGSTFKPNVRVL